MSAIWDDLGFSRDELRKAMRSTYDDLLEFFYSPEFQNIWLELRSMSTYARHEFVREVLTKPNILEQEYRLRAPEGILIQRSSFGDSRPTVFCLKKFLPERFHLVWENVNLTFDELYDFDERSREPDVAWRAPIRPDIQSILMGAGLPVDEIPDKFRMGTT